MSLANKVLLVFTGVVFLVIGGLYRYQQLTHTPESPDINTRVLLDAKLIPINTQSSSIKSQLAPLTLLNFWASWCAPCREEMPIFNHVYQQYQSSGFTVIGIAIEEKEKAQIALDSLGIEYPNFSAQITGMQLLEKTGNTNRLLPYSLLVNQQGKVLEKKLGLLSQQQLQNWVQKHLPTP